MMLNRRVVSDIKTLYDEPMDDIGIYHTENETNINNLKVLIIGPKNTPYEGGFFFFNILFPNNYPMSPPNIEFRTLNSHVRFNPNLYNYGTVCLSIINTWNGPGWSPCYDIASVLRIILSMVFVEYPLRNEPGFNTKSIEILERYNDVLYHEVNRIAIIDMLQNIPDAFKYFTPTIHKHFVDNYHSIYLKNATLLQQKYKNSFVKSPIYDMKFKCNYEHIIYKLQNIYNDLTQITDCPVANPNIPVANPNIPVANSNIPVANSNIPVANPNIPVANSNIPVANSNIPVANSNIPVVGVGIPVVGLDIPVANPNIPVVGLDIPVVGVGIPVVGLDIPVVKIKKKKNTPNVLAKTFEVGHMELSINDNKMYVVKLRKNDVYYWKKMI
jgi:ubiquitin-conjugating enzyme E2 Z